MTHELIKHQDVLMHELSIAGYGMLADCNKAGLGGLDGSIDWLCLPCDDSRSVFASVVDPGASAEPDRAQSAAAAGQP